MALWLDLVPKINKPTDSNDGSDKAQHMLDNANNQTLFDDPEGLISRNKFHRIFPLPTSYPSSQRPLNDVHIFSPDVTDDDIVSTHQPTMVGLTDHFPEVTLKDSAELDESNLTEHSTSVPFSITVSIGCFLLFINIIIYAGIFCQRERIRKLKQEHTDRLAVTENENNSNEQEYERVKDNHYIKSRDHDNDPTYSTLTISQEQTDRHSYTQVPTQTNSPMHRTVVYHNSSMTSFGKYDHSLNHINKPVLTDTGSDVDTQTICTGTVNAVTVV